MTPFILLPIFGHVRGARRVTSSLTPWACANSHGEDAESKKGELVGGGDSGQPNWSWLIVVDNNIIDVLIIVHDLITTSTLLVTS